jgi:hypothetical protein
MSRPIPRADGVPPTTRPEPARRGQTRPRGPGRRGGRRPGTRRLPSPRLCSSGRPAGPLVLGGGGARRSARGGGRRRLPGDGGLRRERRGHRPVARGGGAAMGSQLSEELARTLEDVSESCSSVPTASAKGPEPVHSGRSRSSRRSPSGARPDPVLDVYAQSCFLGDLQACDDLMYESAPLSAPTRTTRSRAAAGSRRTPWWPARTWSRPRRRGRPDPPNPGPSVRGPPVVEVGGGGP